MIILSILIPSTPERSEMTSKLLGQLNKQKEFVETNWISGNVEIIVDDSIRFLDGGLSIGMKRDGLVKKANGKYLCFLDSDDSISGLYLQSLVIGCASRADIVTFRSFANLENFWALIDMSLNHDVNEQAKSESIVKRRPWHICPVKSIIAKKHSFEDISYGEDWKWFEKVLTGCKTQFKTDEILHMYNHRTSESEADLITKSNV